MARNCNCAGGQCGCLVTGGTAITVTGTGTANDPYVIVNTGAALGTAIQVNDTTTLNLTKAGAGTNADPIILSGDVTLKMQQLLDVNDPQGGPLAGEVPFYVGVSGADGHWEFRPPSQASVASPVWKVNYLLSFMDEQLLPLERPQIPGLVALDRLYPIPFTGPVGVNFTLPVNSRPTGPGTYITVSDPPNLELMPDYRGLVFGQVTGITSPNTYKVQAGKITDAFYPFGPPATPDANGFFAVDLASVETWRAGIWALQLEKSSAPGVAVGGLWKSDGPVYTDLNVELHAVSDSDYLVKSVPAPVSGHVNFYSSTPGIKRAVLRDTATGKNYSDTEYVTGNIRSYLVAPGQPGYGTGFQDQSYVYDQAVALCAAIAAGDHDQSLQLMRGLGRLQTKSGAQKGGFRFSGRQGSAEYGDPAYRTGAHALATFGVLAYAQAFPQSKAEAVTIATDALTWMQTQFATSGNRSGLYLGGVGVYNPDGGGGQSLDEFFPLTWASTEHNIDAYFALKLAGKVLGGTYAAQSDTLATVMLSKLWNTAQSRLNQGLTDTGADTADPLDVHSWGSIFLNAAGRNDYAVLTMSDAQLAPFKFTRTAPNGKQVTGYATAYDSAGYPGMVPHVWWEGTYSVAYAMSKLAQLDRWYKVMVDAAPGQFPDGSFPYVSDYDATYELVPYRSVASTGWAILATVGAGIFDTGAIPS